MCITSSPMQASSEAQHAAAEASRATADLQEISARTVTLVSEVERFTAGVFGTRNAGLGLSGIVVVSRFMSMCCWEGPLSCYKA